MKLMKRQFVLDVTPGEYSEEFVERELETRIVSIKRTPRH